MLIYFVRITFKQFTNGTYDILNVSSHHEYKNALKNSASINYDGISNVQKASEGKCYFKSHLIVEPFNETDEEIYL